MNRFLRFVAVALALAIVIVPAAVFAQQTESRITGRVLDDSKAAMPGVTVDGHVEEHRRRTHGGHRWRWNVYRDESESRRVHGHVRVVGVCESVARCRARRRPVRDRRCDAGRRVAAGSRDGVGRVERHRHLLGAHRRQRVARGSRQPAGERPQLREPDDAGDRRDERRQRRLGERPLQRQVQSAELPQLRRRRRHLRVGREPRISELDRLAVPPADVDGVGCGVPREFRPRAR